MERTGGIVLMIAAVLALIAANSPLAGLYHDLFHAPVTIGVGPWVLDRTLHFWINDGLMSIFFFAIGLEIKREVLVGQLSSLRRSALPLAGALGGMIVPALIFSLLNAGGTGSSGWGIPMATDIAFALGVLALLGRRVPGSIHVYLMALAVADDLGAVLVIAIFYSQQIVLTALAVAVAGLGAAFTLNALNVRHPLWYSLIGIVVWLAFLKSGVHPTIAGVLLGLTIPVRALYDGQRWLHRVESLLRRYRNLVADGELDEHGEIALRQSYVHRIESASEGALSPLTRLEHALRPWVAFVIMPVFAFANAGVAISPEAIGAAVASSVTWGAFLGLLVGKQAGVFLFSWGAVRLRLAQRPEGASWRQLYGAALLAGIGFTMSLFITELAFPGSGAEVDAAKVGILAASLAAGIVGYLWLRRLPDPSREPATT